MGSAAQTPREGGWKMGRGKMHVDWSEEGKIKWDEEPCNLCGTCVETCPLEAITLENKLVTFDHDLCIRCGRCARVCEQDASEAPVSFEYFSKAVAEGAQAAIDTFAENKLVYINFLMDIQPECDCVFAADTPVAQNIGIMMSHDPLAIDTASMDMIEKEKPLPNSKVDGLEIPEGQDIFTALHGNDSRRIIKVAEELGLGQTEYEIIEIK